PLRPSNLRGQAAKVRRKMEMRHLRHLDGLNKKRLQALLKGFGEYPTKYRMFVWRSLLQLPENHLTFSSLLDKGTHPAFAHLQNKYPIKINWCQHWFEYFPNPPINVLSMVENILAHHDKELLQHLMNFSVTSQIYAWPLLETMFSEVLTREEWLKVFDNIFSNHPSYFLMVVAAYITCSRAPLLHCNQKDDFELVHEIEGKAIQRRVEDEAWYRKQELLREAEEQRRKILLEEEEKLADQRRRLAAVKRELKVKELQLLDAARKRFLKYQQDQRQMELNRLGDEISRKVSMRDQETAATIQDIEVRQMELESQRRLFEQQLLKEQETVTQEVKGEMDATRRKADLEERLLQRLTEINEAEDHTAQTVSKLENLAKAGQELIDTEWRTQALHKQRCDDLDREEHYKELAKLLHDNRIKEAELLNAMKEEEAKRWEEIQAKRDELEAERFAATASDAHRKQLLEHEINDAIELAEKLQSEDGYFGECARYPHAVLLAGTVHCFNSTE
uniref:TBC1 domain family member 31 n=1 Tax=Sphenodon punctatus TaxID=8508 RepID=A0A8D0GB26_SPHPU